MSARCCSNCDALREALAEAHLVLGWSRDTGRELAFTRAFKLSPMRAAILASLYAAKGRMVTYSVLIDAISFAAARRDRNGDRDEVNLLKVTMVYVRQRVGPQSIDTIWGRGFRQTDAGLALCDAALAEFGGAS